MVLLGSLRVCLRGYQTKIAEGRSGAIKAIIIVAYVLEYTL
jgi:hypothetical protein